MSDTSEQPEDFELAFRRARRALGNLWNHYTGRAHGPVSPETCDGCREIHRFLTHPDYRGDEHYPVGVTIDPDWKFGPNEMELPRS